MVLDDRKPEASVEAGLAAPEPEAGRHGCASTSAAQVVEAPVTSLRKLEWGSMRVNFFVILNPAA
jgi:putative ABC transport system permease protein